jgi:hypothetical protein
MELRMGVHSGPVSGVVDVGGRANVAGAGINVAQRIMDCGDAGHILLSKHVAEDLEQLGHWHRHLHDLGECEVKHGARVSAVNLYTEDLGNPQIPQKFLQARKGVAPVVREKPNKKWIVAAVVAILAAAIVAAIIFKMAGTNRPAVQAPPKEEGRPAGAAPTASPAAAIPEKSIAVSSLR